VAKLQKSMDPRKVWDEFQKELGRYLQSPPVSDPQTGEPILLASTQSVSTGSWQPGKTIYGDPDKWMSDLGNLKYIFEASLIPMDSADSVPPEQRWTLGHDVFLVRAIHELRDNKASTNTLNAFQTITNFVFKELFGMSLPSTPIKAFLSVIESFDTVQLANEVFAFHRKLINLRARPEYSKLTPTQILNEIYPSDVVNPYQKYDRPTIVSLYIAVTGDKDLTGKLK
jgi:hypothetical protein